MLDSISGRRVRSSSQSPRRATNLNLSLDVLETAKALNINISQICDAHLRKVVKEELTRRWRKEYADFVTAYNEALVTEGLPLDEWKTF